MPPPVQPQEVIRYGLAVNGRLKEGASLKVSVAETFIPANSPSGSTAPTPTSGSSGWTGALTLCYQHGTSRRFCGASQTGQWTVRLESGGEQFLTLRIGGQTVARVVYRDVRIAGPPARGTAPLDATPKPARVDVEPAAVSATGGLSGPKSIRVGAEAYFWWDHVAPSTLCYRHGTSRMRCQRSWSGGFDVMVLPGRDQYFTLRVSGKVLSRLVYHHVA
jgi:hypothetical protein